MAKSKGLYLKVEPELKEEAEKVLEELGLNMSNAIGMFLKQVVMQKAIPFKVEIPKDRRPLFLDEMTEDEIMDALEEGTRDIEEGRVYTIEQTRNKINNLLNDL